MVVGCSEQLPNELRAYHVVGTTGAGGLLLGRDGVTYSAATGEVSSYRDVLERMLGKVLANLPPSLRLSARTCLTKRWNRDWGVDAEDRGTSGSPFDLSQPRIDSDGSFQPHAALAGN